jgi:hypothetical protein
MRVCQTRHILNLCRSKHHHVVARHRFDRLGADPPGLNSDSSRDTHFTTARSSQANGRAPINVPSYGVIGRLLSMGILRRFNLR